MFHMAWEGNIVQWEQNPLQVGPVPHGVWDPHFCLSLRDAYSGACSDFGSGVVLAYSGLFEWS
jgi:hypothetical protein